MIYRYVKKPEKNKKNHKSLPFGVQPQGTKPARKPAPAPRKALAPRIVKAEPPAPEIRIDRLRPADLVGAIDVLDRVAFVEVPQKHAQRVIDALGNTKLRGRRPKIGYAHPR